MKKFLPFLFPLVALLVVIFLAVRWYNSQTDRSQAQLPEFAEGIRVENLNPTEVNNLRNGVKDTKSVKLTGAGEATGEVRYDVKDGKVLFSVYANLPTLTEGRYQVWLKDVNSEARKKAFVLELGKGGYMGNGSVLDSTLPFEVVISKEMSDDMVLELPILKGTVN